MHVLLPPQLQVCFSSLINYEMEKASLAREDRFVEEQFFWQQPLSWIVWLGALGCLYGLMLEGLITQTFGYVAIIAVLGIMFLIFSTKLATEVSKGGILIRMRPIQRTEKHIDWSEIEHVEIVKYKPWKDYGGRGVRVGRHGTGYHIKGNIGLQIKLKKGKRILIGTQKSDELKSVLLGLGKYDPNSKAEFV